MGDIAKNRKIIQALHRLDLDDFKNLNNLMDMCIAIREDDLELALSEAKTVKQRASIGSRKNISFAELYWKAMLFLAPYDLDSFILYMERNRPAKERFYLPRRKVLNQVVDAIQDLAEDKLDELFINMPPRVGKTQLVKFAYVWWGSRNSELSNLYTAYSDKITKAFNNGCIELMTDPTYTYAEIFPNNRIAATNGEDETIHLNRKKTYPTYTCRSIYGTLNGSCDCNGLGIADDLFSGIEEAISIERQETVWGKFDNNFMPRLKQKAKLINMGTRWALGDCQGRRRTLLETNLEYRNRRYRVICLSALDENDESNFDYPYDVGYNTEYYRQRRASFEENDDMASWNAQYMQDPIERQGALFTSGTMNFFAPSDLPDREPDRIFMAIDEAFGGGDYVSGPVCLQYDEVGYIIDVVFDNGDKYVTRPLIVDIILKYQVQAARFEETKETADYREWIEDELKKKYGYRLNSTGKPTPGKLGKRARIFDKAPEIREMYYLKPEFRSKPYQKFMNNIFVFKMEGKVKHDDGPDSMAQLCAMKLMGPAKVQIYSRSALGI